MDDNDENLPFSVGIRNASIPKITPYTSKWDPLRPCKHLQDRDEPSRGKSSINMQGFSSYLVRGSKEVVQQTCRRKHLQLAGVEEDIHQLLLVWKPASALVQRLHDIRQAKFEPLQSYLSHFNEEMLFCERIFDAEALSAFKGRLDMNLPFWKRHPQQESNNL
ncbi:Uncharacterized protein Adt_34138 [Abeliophyllum distichum]|uniref:Uncharacterized protein n=1 Tax=Abeliophyllum distichum TaxID=126358 RepID=A0ABD1QY96_9LAMI